MMKKIIFVIVVLGLVACADSKYEKALALLEQAKENVRNNEWNAAQIVLDSIHQEYATVVAVRRMADTLSWQIQRMESERTLAYIDSVMPSKKAEFDALKKDFIFTKDTLYQDFGTYVYRRMSLGYNVQRTYLRPMVDERGLLSIMSQYYGATSVQHHAMRFDSEEVIYRTKESGAYNAFDDDGNFAESLIFDGDEALNIANFIAERTQNRIKVTLIGVRDYVYYLTMVDKDAIAATLNFSTIVSDCYRLEQERKKALLRIEKLNARLQ